MNFKEKDEWKKEVSELLKKYDLISKNFTGKTILNFSQGGLADMKRIETIK